MSSSQIQSKQQLIKLLGDFNEIQLPNPQQRAGTRHSESGNYFIFLKTKLLLALPGWLSWLEHRSAHEKVVGVIPAQGTYLGLGFGSQSGQRREAAN